MPPAAWALALLSPVGAAAADSIVIDHVPPECVLYGRYARIAARGTPAEGVASAQLQFRARGEGAWYSVGMVAEGTEWSAYLPRPVRPLERLEYRIVMRAVDAGEAATSVFAARVRDEGECARPATSSASLAAPIVVHVPPGAPAVPPVPAGFSPAGVMAIEEPVRRASGLKKAVGAGVAGGIAAAAIGLGVRSEGQPPAPSEPAVVFVGTAPAPGSVVSLSRSQLEVIILVTRRMQAGVGVANISWSFQLMASDTVCTAIGGSSSPLSLPARIALTGSSFAPSACGTRFDVDRARLRVSINDEQVLDQILWPMPFHFEP